VYQVMTYIDAFWVCDYCFIVDFGVRELGVLLELGGWLVFAMHRDDQWAGYIFAVCFRNVKQRSSMRRS